MSGPPPTPPPVPPGGSDAVRIGAGINKFLDEANEKLSPTQLKALVQQMKSHAVFKHKLK
jgi:hypothetical protein